MSVRNLRQPHAALADLCDGFFDSVEWTARCRRLHPDELPEPFQLLLVHREHMTERLEACYGRPVELVVLAQQRAAHEYARKILLTLRGWSTRVEFGIVRMNLELMSAPVREEILATGAPLGDILIRHGVFRRVSPRWYFEFPGATPIADEFAPGETLIGRVGTIYCDEEPAIELLEVVRDARES